MKKNKARKGDRECWGGAQGKKFYFKQSGQGKLHSLKQKPEGGDGASHADKYLGKSK